ncbi:hypothetical protein COCC4DRAFT_65300 [Bipolaris maydis ATCC 48331]|uniref:Uncharacterized protein n=2 Tax=Cochliobolus heterostrophus TaxID=5016 RepID=M2USK9_COCH5|nr:uncharacterized protein COCC4DRAFT_65300 [Bipolaris maydis ATCC 48331]EMD96586.1 hypothetical protein COCHEDRAFT_1025112 [Bipolaris maydis C5]ENI00587.1 hypothetical protein COCC4DRAFT_65300 [Bipolaris maydis ATCC 48331]KAJ5031527.1 hypothetical protein J3E73DRAFT_252505 [Bipolaris maydis]KAJ6211233.1 hypothetical protein PSV09DRAFT_1025112 [Bipolaris maydis]
MPRNNHCTTSAIFFARSNPCNKEIRKSRDNAWAAFNTRKHIVLRVYSSKANASDLLFIALVAMDLKNGEHVEGEFVGRLEFQDTQSFNPKIKSYGVWAVRQKSTPELSVATGGPESKDVLTWKV